VIQRFPLVRVIMSCGPVQKYPSRALSNLGVRSKTHVGTTTDGSGILAFCTVSRERSTFFYLQIRQFPFAFSMLDANGEREKRKERFEREPRTRLER
jgi:hypothetical protein